MAGQPSSHEGVVGLIAGRLRERCHRPVAAFAESGCGRESKGSARSLPELHIRDALTRIARQGGLNEAVSCAISAV